MPAKRRKHLKSLSIYTIANYSFFQSEEQRGGYWNTRGINYLSLFIKNMYSHVENLAFSPPQWAFSSQVH